MGLTRSWPATQIGRAQVEQNRSAFGQSGQNYPQNAQNYKGYIAGKLLTERGSVVGGLMTSFTSHVEVLSFTERHELGYLLQVPNYDLL